ncbi:MAG: saccharopine dehydrogenase NADP-binding domain-containing protein [Chlorobia bacterium]|nr:saccharopine dehydrogenase NADP-binding domain-containing protein [Fimbriimonadaceae bacterium]
MQKTFAILGSGMQGTAAAYDLAKHADPKEIRMGDALQEQAQRNADRVNQLVGRTVCTAHQVDALDPENLGQFLDPIDVVLSCVPYWMHPRVAAVAIRHKTNMVDMGGDTAVAWETLKLDEQAKSEGISIVPDTGLAPGLVNDLGNYLIEQFDQVESVRLYCGGLPQNPKPPFNYKLVFNIEGLVTEYSHRADVVRDGKIVQVDTLAELEKIHVDGLGEMEAFTTSGGASTAPFTHEGKLGSYEYKTIRFPGHCERMRLFKDYGFWGAEPVVTRSGEAIPIEVFHKLMGEAFRDPSDKDQVIVRGVGVGSKQRNRKRIQLDIHEKHDDATGFTAMERLTGFSTATYAKHVAGGHCGPGCHRYETAMTGVKFLGEIQERGIRVKIQESAA